MIPRETLKNIRRIEIRTRRSVNDVFAGRYHSVFKGQGMEFQEVREYVPGDDIRSIDWNVTARTGSPHVKKFTEERELTVMLLVDISASNRFGSTMQLKRDLESGRYQKVEGDKIPVRIQLDDGSDYPHPGKLAFAGVIVNVVVSSAGS